MARPHIEPFVDRSVSFRRMTLPGFRKGMHYKTLSMDTDSGACTLSVKFESGYKLPPGMCYTELEIFVQTGYIKYGDVKHTAGSYFRIPPGVSMPAMSTPRGATALYFYNFAEPSFEESDEDHDRGERDRLIEVNAYDDMSWTGTNIFPATAPGCMVKILKYDERSHAFTFMYCMTPNFWQDNISYHDCCEEAYHIWGDSWMMQFGDLPTGGYFWRPPYINHGAFASKLGILAIGRTDSELYNHFHFNPWTTPQENRERAGSRLLHWKPEMYRWIQAQDGHNHPHTPHDFEYDSKHHHDHEDDDQPNITIGGIDL